MVLPVVQIMAQLQEGVLDDNDAMAEEKAGEAVDEAEEGSKRFATV